MSVEQIFLALSVYLCYTRFIPTRFREFRKIMLILLFLSFGISPDVFRTGLHDVTIHFFIFRWYVSLLLRHILPDAAIKTLTSILSLFKGGLSMATNLLKSYFPMIQSREEILARIYSNPKLQQLFESWTVLQQKEFLDFCSGAKGIKVLYDSFFKEVMNPEYDPARLESFLTTLLNRKVRIKEVLPNDSTRLSDESSLLITDIIVELEDGTLANIEVQKIGYAFPGARCACYSSDMLLRQYKRARQRSIDPVTGKDTFSYRCISKVYLIVLYENSPSELKQCPDHWIHRSKTIFDTGLSMDLLQDYIFISLDIFRSKMHNKKVTTLLEAWMTFFSTDDPEEIIKLITDFPQFKPMYETLYQMCRNVENVMGFFSEELREMDRNTVRYMIDELQKEVDLQKAAIAEKDSTIAALQARIRELESGNSSDLPS